MKKKYSAKEKAYRKIKADIFSGKLKPNDRLNEIELSSVFNVSRTPIREAMRQLEKEGFAYSKPRIGTFVCEITENDLMEIFSIRSKLEPSVFISAYENITDKEINELQSIITKNELEIENENFVQVTSYFDDFRYAINRISALKHTVNVLSRLGALQYIVLQYEMDNKKAYSLEVLEEHKQIMNAIVNRDFTKYVDVTTTHIENAKRRYMRVKKTLINN